MHRIYPIAAFGKVVIVFNMATSYGIVVITTVTVAIERVPRDFSGSVPIAWIRHAQE